MSPLDAAVRALLLLAGAQRLALAVRSKEALRWTGFKTAAQSYPLLTSLQHGSHVAPLEHSAASPTMGFLGHSFFHKVHPAVAPLGMVNVGLDYLDGGGSPADDDESPKGDAKADDLKHLFVLNRDDFHSILRLPSKWLDNFVAGSARRAWLGPNSEVHVVQLKSDHDFWVALKGVETGSPGMVRELHIRRRLSMLHRSGFAPAGNIVPMLAHGVLDSLTYFMLPACEVSMKQLMDTQRKTTSPTPGTPLLPPELSLLLTIDILRGLKNLEKAGVLHNALYEGNVMISDSRAFIMDFSSACVMHEDSDGLRSMEFLEDQPRVTRLSPYRLAPEMVGGVPTGHANSVWALGIILARLTLGYVPTMPHGEEPKEDEMFLEDASEGQRRRVEHVRSRIEKHFKIHEAPGFDEAPKYMQELLGGMLNKNEEKRWTVEKALEYSLKVADDNFIFVPPEVSLPLELPESWTGGRGE